MSTIIFNRMIQNADSNVVPQEIEEFDEDDYDFNQSDIHSKSYLINFYKVGDIFFYFF